MIDGHRAFLFNKLAYRSAESAELWNEWRRRCESVVFWSDQLNQLPLSERSGASRRLDQIKSARGRSRSHALSIDRTMMKIEAQLLGFDVYREGVY